MNGEQVFARNLPSIITAIHSAAAAVLLESIFTLYCIALHWKVLHRTQMHQMYCIASTAFKCPTLHCIVLYWNAGSDHQLWKLAVELTSNALISKLVYN